MAPAGYGDRVEGIHAVIAAANAGRVRRLYVEEGRQERSEVAALIRTVGPEQVSVVDDARSLATTEAPQGVIAECHPIPSVTLEALAGEVPSIMVLDHLEDPHNVGAIARSARAAGLSGMVVSARRAAPLSAAAFKAAAGALETLPVAIVGSIPEAMSRLGDMGVWLVGLDSTAVQSLFGLELLSEPVAVVVGAEGAGLSRLAAERCDVLAAIPMADGAESLNASVSAALASFEIMRARDKMPG